MAAFRSERLVVVFCADSWFLDFLEETRNNLLRFLHFLFSNERVVDMFFLMIPALHRSRPPSKIVVEFSVLKL